MTAASTQLCMRRGYVKSDSGVRSAVLMPKPCEDGSSGLAWLSGTSTHTFLMCIKSTVCWPFTADRPLLHLSFLPPRFLLLVELRPLPCLSMRFLPTQPPMTVPKVHTKQKVMKNMPYDQCTCLYIYIFLYMWLYILKDYRQTDR